MEKEDRRRKGGAKGEKRGRKGGRRGGRDTGRDIVATSGQSRKKQPVGGDSDGDGDGIRHTFKD